MFLLQILNTITNALIEQDDGIMNKNYTILFLSNTTDVEHKYDQLTKMFLTYKICKAQGFKMFEQTKKTKDFVYKNDEENGVYCILDDFNPDKNYDYFEGNIYDFDDIGFQSFMTDHDNFFVNKYIYRILNYENVIDELESDLNVNIDDIKDRYRQLLDSTYIGFFNVNQNVIRYYKQNTNKKFEYNKIAYENLSICFANFVNFILLKARTEQDTYIQPGKFIKQDNFAQKTYEIQKKDASCLHDPLSTFDHEFLAYFDQDFPCYNAVNFVEIFLEIDEAKRDLFQIEFCDNIDEIKAMKSTMIKYNGRNNEEMCNENIILVCSKKEYKRAITFKRMSANIDAMKIQKLIEALIDIVRLYNKQIKNKGINNQKVVVSIEYFEKHMCENNNIINPVINDATLETDANETAETFDINIVVNDQCLLHILIRYLRNLIDLKLILTTSNKYINQMYLHYFVMDEGTQVLDNTIYEKSKTESCDAIFDLLILSESKSSFIKIYVNDLVSLDKNIIEYKNNLRLYEKQNISGLEKTEHVSSDYKDFDESAIVNYEHNMFKKNKHIQSQQKEDITKQDGNLICYEYGNVKYYTLLDQNIKKYCCCLRLLYNFCVYNIPNDMSMIFYAYKNQKEEYKKLGHNDFVIDIYVKQKEVQLYFFGSKDSVIANLKGFNAKLTQNVTKNELEIGHLYLQQCLEKQINAQSIKELEKNENNICAASFYKKSYNDTKINTNNPVRSESQTTKKKPITYKTFVKLEHANLSKSTSNMTVKLYSIQKIIALTTDKTDIDFYENLKIISKTFSSKEYIEMANTSNTELKKMQNDEIVVKIYKEKPTNVDICKIYVIFYYLQNIYRDCIQNYFKTGINNLKNESEDSDNKKTTEIISSSKTNAKKPIKDAALNKESTEKQKKCVDNDFVTSDSKATNQVRITLTLEKNAYAIFILAPEKKCINCETTILFFKGLSNDLDVKIQSLDSQEWSNIKGTLMQTYLNDKEDIQTFFYSLISFEALNFEYKPQIQDIHNQLSELDNKEWKKNMSIKCLTKDGDKDTWSETFEFN